MNYSKNEKKGKWLVIAGITVIVLVVLVRCVLFYVRSDGLSGMSTLFLLLAAGILIFALLMSCLFAVWVYHDCKKRNDDGILWAAIVFITTPFIGLLVYFLRRSEIKKNCIDCGHLVSLKAKFCEECGTKIEKTEEITAMELQRTHHISYIVLGMICMALMLTCLAGFIVSAAWGKGINADITSNEKVWNKGSIIMSQDVHVKGVWKLSFKSASDGFVAQKNMKVKNVESECLYADISCKTIPADSSLTLYLVQGEVVKSFDVTTLSKPFEYPLTEFQNGEIHVRLLINGVEETVSEIYIK